MSRRLREASEGRTPFVRGRSSAALNAAHGVSTMPITFDRRQALIATATGLCGIARGAQAQGLPPGASAPLIPRRLLFADPARSVVRISPDGRRIAFLAPLEGVLNLWVAAIDDVANARALTRVTDRSLGLWLLWLHDNRHVVFFREQGGDENWQAHRVDATTGDILALTPAPG